MKAVSVLLEGRCNWVDVGSVSNELLGKSRTTFLHPMSVAQNCHSVFVPLIDIYVMIWTLVCVNRPRLLCDGPAPYVIVTSIRYKIQTYKLLKGTLI